MGLLANIIIIISILIVVTLAAVFGALAPTNKSGGQTVCDPGYSVVNGVCKADQFTSCQTNSDCVPNLICGPDHVCISPPPTEIPPPTISTTEPTIVVRDVPEPISSPLPVKLPPSRQIRQQIVEIQSLDDERNSNGTISDVKVYDVHSTETTPQDIGSISTPYQEQDGAYYCKSSEDSGVIDAISYSTYTVFLMNDGTVILEGKGKRLRITCNVKLSRIVSFAQRIYGISGTSLYVCHDSDPDLPQWLWDKVKWASLPSKITYINTPYNMKNLLVQDGTTGYIYNEAGGLISQYNCNGEIRICAKDMFRYATFNQLEHSARIYPSGETYRNIADLAFDYHGGVITIPLNADLKYKRIAMVNWRPYFIC